MHKIIGIFVGLLVAAGIAAAPIIHFTTMQEQTCTVVDKDRTTNREGDSEHRVYTDECGVLTVSDSLLDLNFHSADTYRQLDPGHTYTLRTNGFRAPFLSMFPNVLSVEEEVE